MCGRTFASELTKVPGYDKSPASDRKGHLEEAATRFRCGESKVSNPASAPAGVGTTTVIGAESNGGIRDGGSPMGSAPGHQLGQRAAPTLEQRD